MANFTALAAARWRLLTDAGWDLDGDGLTGAPRIRCFVGRERHDTIDLGLRYWAWAVPRWSRPTARAGSSPPNLTAPWNWPCTVRMGRGGRSSACRPEICIPGRSTLSPRRSPWPRRTGPGCTWTAPSGCGAAAVPELAALTAGVSLADSWGTDAHKSLNVPYDCGIVVVRDARALRSAMGLHTSYLIQAADGGGDPAEKVPELSRRARGVPVWAALKSLGRDGVTAQIRGLADRRRAAGRATLRPRRRRGAQRRRLHPGLAGLRRRRRDPQRDATHYQRRQGLDVRFAMAGP